MTIRGSALRPSMISKVLVCVDRLEYHDIAGRILSPYLPEPIVFGTCHEMVFNLEDFFDRVSFPCAHYRHRKFRAKRKNARLEKQESEVRQYMSEDLFVNESGEKATFIVHVRFRQNATWQGSITWTEGKKTQRFRSMLEMLKLMDSALDPEDGDAADFSGGEPL